MKTGISLQDLAAKIEANRELKRDFVADTRHMEMRVQPAQANEKPIALLNVRDQGDFPLMPLAHDQIGARLKIPAQYYDRMLAEEPALLAQNVNTWLHHKPETRMVRTLAANARAFLSNRYQRVENEHIAEVALPVLADLPGVQIVSCEVTDARLYIHFVVPTIQGEVKVGDVVQAGGIISNSEVGLGSISVSGLIWRLWCLNGAKTADTFRKNHVGRAVEDNEALWAQDTIASDDRTVLLKVRDMVRAVVDETRFRARLDQMRGLTDARITGDIQKSVEVLGAAIGLQDGERSGVLKSLIEGGDLSAWGLMNAVTHQAHGAKTYDRAVDFEAMGGQVLELPKDQWRRVLEAA